MSIEVREIPEDLEINQLDLRRSLGYISLGLDFQKEFDFDFNPDLIQEFMSLSKIVCYLCRSNEMC